jgi:hypothetical protein
MVTGLLELLRDQLQFIHKEAAALAEATKRIDALEKKAGAKPRKWKLPDLKKVAEIAGLIQKFVAIGMTLKGGHPPQLPPPPGE